MKHQSGFGVVAAIVVLVIMATLAAAIVSIGSVQQTTSAQDVLSSRAWQAARAGTEWGLFTARNSQNWGGAGTTCDTATRTVTLDLTADTGFRVTITCDSWSYNEGETVPGTPNTVRVYRIAAVACPAAACPDTSTAVSAPGYVERRRTVFAMQ